MDKRITLAIILGALIIISILFFNIDSSPTPSKYSCTTALDCVPSVCCHPTEAVNYYYAPDCAAVSCTASCEGPLDCGRGTIECIENRCTIVPNNP